MIRTATLVLLAVLTATAGGAEEWQRFSGPGVQVEAHPHHAGFAESLARSFPARVAEVKTALGVAPPAFVRVTVGRDAEELAERLSVSLRPWVAGVAVKGHARIGINASSLRPPASLPASVIVRHELAHLTLGQRLGRERGIPLWLEEGICQWVGGSAYLGQRSDLVARLSFDELIPWDTLAHAFPADRREATYAYLQSYAFVDYLATVRGGPFLLDLTDAVARGVPVHDALLDLTGRAQVDLEKAWMQYERDRGKRLLYLMQAISPLAVGALLLLLAWRRRVRMARFLLERMDEEETASLAVPPIRLIPTTRSGREP